MSPETTIVPYRDGPYLVRGPVVLRDQNGGLIEHRRSTVALCRCGKSRTRPFCDGTHQLIRFTAPSPREDRLESIRPGSSVLDTERTQDPFLSIRRLLLQARRDTEAPTVQEPHFADVRRQLAADLRDLADRLEDDR